MPSTETQPPVAGHDGSSNSPATSKSPSSCMFYKLIFASTLQDKKLKIPEKFVKKYGNELSSFVTVTVPNSRSWLVELQKVDSKIWFHNGWDEFVEFYSIRDGYFLVFRYEGKSNFKVFMFDLTVSEVKYPFSTFSSLQENINQCQAPPEKDAEYDDIKEVLCSDSPCPPPVSSGNMILYGYNFNKEVSPYPVRSGSMISFGSHNCNKGTLCSGSPYPPPVPSGSMIPYGGHNFDWNETKNHGACAANLFQGNNAYNFGGNLQISQGEVIKFNESATAGLLEDDGLVFPGEAKRRTRKRKRRNESTPRKLKAKPVCSEVTSETFTRRWRAVTMEERKKTVHAANMFKPNNPFFKVVLRPSYVYKGFLLHVPSFFARKYLNVTGFITLQVSDGKKWRVWCYSINGQAKLNKGWTEFVWENNLEEGDACVFELVSEKDVVLMVTIFRVLELEIEAPLSQIFRIKSGSS